MFNNHSYNDLSIMLITFIGGHNGLCYFMFSLKSLYAYKGNEY